jgi:hypothetical protein
MMLRAKKRFFVLSALFSLEFLSLGLLANGLFSWAAGHVPPLLNAAARINARAVTSDSRVKIDRVFVLEQYGESPAQPAGFITLRGNGEPSRRRAIAALRFAKIVLAPKISRYISKSVLNI